MHPAPAPASLKSRCQAGIYAIYPFKHVLSGDKTFVINQLVNYHIDYCVEYHAILYYTIPYHIIPNPTTSFKSISYLVIRYMYSTVQYSNTIAMFNIQYSINSMVDNLPAYY